MIKRAILVNHFVVCRSAGISLGVGLLLHLEERAGDGEGGVLHRHLPLPAPHRLHRQVGDSLMRFLIPGYF